jgi:tetratricopeptide (TPR) repeat protein
MTQSLSEAADPFSLAARALDAERPLKSARLRRIAADPAGAQAELAEHLDRHPDDPDAAYLAARASLAQGDGDEALAQFSRCLTLAPGFARARFDRARLLFKLNRFRDALDDLDRLLRGEPDNPLFRRMKADILRIVGEDAASLACCKAMVADYPEQAPCWIAYGHALRTMGRRDEAIAAYRRAIACRPCSGLAWWGLAGLRTLPLGGEDLRAIEKQLARPEIPPDDRTALQFALGKAFEDQRDYRRAFDVYAKGNAALRTRLDDAVPQRLAARAAAATKALTPDVLGRGGGCPDEGAIFIVGQPRSGSTLLEQIVSSHSAVEGTAELPYIRALAARLEQRGDYPAILATIAPDELAAMGEDYLRGAAQHRRLGRPYFIDKAPANFWHVGLIRMILPNAKIVDARRNPAACLLSMFKLYFNMPRPRLTELGRSYRDYLALMAHFDTAMPGRIHRVFYEALVADPDGQIRALLHYLGLPFEQSCLDFHQSRRTVLTSSSEQVRRPINDEAIASWRRFEPWLGPLIKSLGSAFEAYPEVPGELR